MATDGGSRNPFERPDKKYLVDVIGSIPKGHAAAFFVNTRFADRYYIRCETKEDRDRISGAAHHFGVPIPMEFWDITEQGQLDILTGSNVDGRIAMSIPKDTLPGPGLGFLVDFIARNEEDFEELTSYGFLNPDVATFMNRSDVMTFAASPGTVGLPGERKRGSVRLPSEFSFVHMPSLEMDFGESPWIHPFWMMYLPASEAGLSLADQLIWDLVPVWSMLAVSLEHRLKLLASRGTGSEERGSHEG